METLNDLENHLKHLEQQIREIKHRLPAHSAKPGMVTVLIDLEDERDAVLSRIHAFKRQNCS